MRYILFRGKPTKEVLENESLCKTLPIKDGFVYGNLIYNDKQPYIVGPIADVNDEYCSMEWWCPVEPETVGQFTGLLDKHGIKIFRGDIVDITDHTIEETFEKFGAICKQLMTRRYEVIWNNVQWAISLISNQLVQPIIFELPDQNVTYEIISNIHDNPMMLEA